MNTSAAPLVEHRAWADLSSPEKGELAQRLARDGLTAKEIGRVVGASKNAVISAIWRHADRTGAAFERPDRPPTTEKPPKVGKPAAVSRAKALAKGTQANPVSPRPVVTARAKPPVAKAKAAVALVPRRPVKPAWQLARVEPNDFGDLTGRPVLSDAGFGQCRYPLWPNGRAPRADAQFVCGRPVVEGTSWCASCSRRVYATGREAAE